jgi:hypothetical protein
MMLSIRTNNDRRSPDGRIATRYRMFERPTGSLKQAQTDKALMVWGPHKVGGAELGAERLLIKSPWSGGPMRSMGGAEAGPERL